MASSLSRRLAAAEDAALDRYVEAEAERIAGLLGANPAVLLERAVAVAEQAERLGWDRAIGELAARAGLSPEELEVRAVGLAMRPADDVGGREP